MKHIIRHGCFETNSSSTHSFSIADSGEYDTINIGEDWVLNIEFGKYWWEIETYSSVFSKLSYVATYLFNSQDIKTEEFEDKWYWLEYIWDNSEVLSFEEKIKNHTWAKIITYDIWSGWCEFWYIDHQSMDVWQEAYENLIDAVFRKDSWFETDNDNH